MIISVDDLFIKIKKVWRINIIDPDKTHSEYKLLFRFVSEEDNETETINWTGTKQEVYKIFNKLVAQTKAQDPDFVDGIFEETVLKSQKESP